MAVRRHDAGDATTRRMGRRRLTPVAGHTSPCTEWGVKCNRLQHRQSSHTAPRLELEPARKGCLNTCSSGPGEVSHLLNTCSSGPGDAAGRWQGRTGQNQAQLLGEIAAREEAGELAPLVEVQDHVPQRQLLVRRDRHPLHLRAHNGGKWFSKVVQPRKNQQSHAPAAATGAARSLPAAPAGGAQ